jgi:hypothetical protein
MSEENNEMLKQIASSLQSIDERLGLLLTNTKLSLESEARNKDYSGELYMRQSTFSSQLSATVSQWEHEAAEGNDQIEMDRPNERSLTEFFERFWGFSMPQVIDDEYNLEPLSCSVTFATFGQKIADEYIGFANRKNRHSKLQKLIKDYYKGMPWEGPSAMIKEYINSIKLPKHIDLDSRDTVSLAVITQRSWLFDKILEKKLRKALDTFCSRIG